jgi:hypothetical protein
MTFVSPKRLLPCCVLILAAALAARAATEPPLLLQTPSLSRTQIAFSFGGDIWTVDRSGGDALPWMFRLNKVGTLVGVRTWGGLIGIGGYPLLMDGGSITAPRWGLYGTKGEWEVENHGIAPDVDVEMDPKLVRQGHDPQLERAVAVALEQLAAHPPVKYPRPPYPNDHQKLPADASSP